MASLITTTKTRRSSSSSRKGPLSHGRGGAGNIGSTASDAEPVTLDTPTLKGDVYTTGRGGSGNMARNSDPEAARRAQDVGGHPRRESTHSTHVGRGGAANVFRPSQAEVEAAKRENKVCEEAVADEKAEGWAVKGLADRGKEFLSGLVGGKKN
ncbi:hypothetical protein BGZ57DRAFT_572047 [Hyaloscypha finlandica]|nr:hypothetical protein F5882DRAFT_480714 [Hyaloscypha sp. PMI_1271]KAH8762809.1 hypothetical protein BGZ57DRAFT_572047 [Hyaloscypha finlandica]